MSRFSVDLDNPAPVPNYLGFQEWVRPRFESATPALPFDQASGATLLPELFAAFATRVKWMEVPAGELDAEGYSKLAELKLLISVLHELRPGWDPFEIARIADIDPETLTNEQIATLRPGTLRFLFLDAVQRSDNHRAVKLLGLLQAHRDTHDPGELSYLESLYWWKSGDWAQTISYAEQVPAGCPDASNALRLMLEAYAHLADQQGFLRILRERAEDAKTLGAPVFALCCLRFASALPPTQDFDYELYAAFSSRSLELDPTDAGSVEYWVAYGQHALEFLEYRQATQAYTSHGARTDPAGPQAKLTEGEAESTLEHLAAEHPRLCQLLKVLGLDAGFPEASEGDDFTRFIVSRVWRIPVGTIPKFEQYETVLRAQFAAKHYDRVVKNARNIAPGLRNNSHPNKVALLQLIHQASVIAGDTEMEQEVTTWLAEQPGWVELLEESRRKIERALLVETMTPVARALYLDGVVALEYTEKNGQEWRDAGMLSLGLFRILEVELNQRLVKPVIDDSRFLTVLPSSRHEIVQSLRKFREYTNDGLMLGQLLELLRQLRAATETSGDMYADWRPLFLERLTETGQRSFADGTLAATISDEARQRFRNPPAHTRYLPLTAARECKIHVDRALQLYSDSFIAVRPETPQVT